MFNPILKQNYPFLTDYFETMFSNDVLKIPNSIVFYGLDALAQYYFSLNIAKILNCMDNKESDCQCQNCNWINKNMHPSVITVSKIDTKPDNDNSKTVISVKQVEMLKQMVFSRPVDYYTVVIFTDNEIVKTDSVQDLKSKFEGINFSHPQSQKLKEDEFYLPKGLSRKVFQEEASNSLLKMIEEPPSKVLFIFLTKDLNDLIETIVSRSATFCLNSKMKQTFDTSLCGEVFNFYFNNFKYNPIEFIEKFNELRKNNKEQSFSYLIDTFEYYLEQVLLLNINNKKLTYLIKKAIHTLENSKKMENSYVRENLIVENIAFSFAKNRE